MTTEATHTDAPENRHRTPAMVLELSAGYTDNGNRRVVAVVLNRSGHEIAVSAHWRADYLATALGVGLHRVRVKPAEVRDYLTRGKASGKLLPVGGEHDAHTALAAAIEQSERTTGDRLRAL